MQSRYAECPCHGDKIRVVIQVYLAFPVVIKQLLMLANHAQTLVVQDDYFYRKLITVNGGQLLNIHHERTIAGNIDNGAVTVSKLRSNSRGQTIAHSAQAAAGQMMAGMIKFVILRNPHLVLAYVAGNNGVVWCST